MSFEIAGARILGPFFGSSVFVWTSLIGVIMGSLSIGYWLGGLVSINKTSFSFLSYLLAISAIFILLTAIGNVYVLERVLKYVHGYRLRTVVGSGLLFGPASILFGMILPYGVKLTINKLSSSGVTVGKLYALSTFGSILGTFLTGFVLMPLLGFANILFLLAAILTGLSFIFLLEKSRLAGIIISGFSVIFFIFSWQKFHNKTTDYIDIDTRYNRVIVFETHDPGTDRPLRMLRVNNENSSAMFTDQDDELPFEVLKYYRLVEHFVPGFSKTLMIGGSGYAFPKDYFRRYPFASMDVVEIDEGLTEVARKYFNLQHIPDLKIFHEDGRTFLNRTTETYDAVFMDAYKSMLTIPFQLTTVEAVEEIYKRLNDNGAVFANVISSLDESNNQFLLSEIKTYQAIFPQVYLLAVQYPDPTEEEKKYFQNFMLIGLKSEIQLLWHNSNIELNEFLSHVIEIDDLENSVVLTDEYAPVEYYSTRMIK